MSDVKRYKAAFEAASADLSAIMSLLGFTSYPGVDPMLRAITDLVLIKAEVQELREKVKYQDAVIKQRNAECSRLFNEREALRSVAMDEEGAFDEWWESSGFYKFRETALAAWEARARLAATQGGPDHA